MSDSYDYYDKDEGWYRCPECKSIEVLEYTERIMVFNRNSEHIDTKDWNDSGAFHGLQCEECGWDNF